MKKLAAVLLGAFLIVNFAAAGETSEADKKWLSAVEQMVAKGDTKVSTPKEDRVKLLKEWASNHGYSVQVDKTDAGFRIELSKSVAQK